MRKTKMKLFTIIIAVALIFCCLVACGDANTEPKDSKKKSEQAPLAPALEEDIKRAFCEHLGYSYLTPDVITSLDIVAEVNGVYAFFARGFDSADVVTYDRVNRIVFSYPSGNKMKIYSDGKVYGVTEAYNERIIGDETLKAIHRMYYEDDINEMIDAFYEDAKEIDKNLKKENITFKFMTQIDGAFAVIIDAGWMYDCAMGGEVVNGVRFMYPTSSKSYGIKIYEDGEFYRLSEAFDKGIIDMNMLREIYKVYHGFNDKKIICEATLDETFDDNEIIVTLNKYFCYDDYSTSDFAELGCIELERGVYYRHDLENGNTTVLHLTLSEHSKENVLDTIKELERRNDVYKAEPLYRAVDLSDMAIDPAPLSEERKGEIKTAFSKSDGMNGVFEWYEGESLIGLNPLMRVRYYGEYNECIILYRGNPLGEFEHITVAGERMEYACGSNIWVYKDGEFLSLSQAHDGGLLSELDVSIIAEYHRRFQKIAYAADKADR